MIEGPPQRTNGSAFAPRDPGIIEVGVGRIAAAKAPRRLMTPALGSCVGVALYEPMSDCGALAHVMLPKPVEVSAEEYPERFAEFAIPKMVDEMLALGCHKPLIVAKLAGGAAMFRADSLLASIGERNVAEVKRQLGLLRIPVLAEDIGGSHARTIELELETGVLTVRSYVFGVKEL